MTPSLSELQRWMRWIVTNPEGPYKALENPQSGRFAEPTPRHLTAVAQQPPIDRLERLSVYADAYILRLLECLAADYPALERCMGKDEFQTVATAYLLKHPSVSPLINDLGDRFPKFLLSQENVPAWAADVARLERSVLQSLYTQRGEPFDPSILKDIDESAWATARCRLDPSLIVLTLQWNVLPAWRARKSPEKPTRISRMASSLVVYRDERWVQAEDVEREEAMVLGRLRAGATLEEACDDLPETQAFELQEWFSRWVVKGWIAGIDF